jgi:hypothetical protein
VCLLRGAKGGAVRRRREAGFTGGEEAGRGDKAAEAARGLGPAGGFWAAAAEGRGEGGRAKGVGYVVGRSWGVAGRWNAAEVLLELPAGGVAVSVAFARAGKRAEHYAQTRAEEAHAAARAVLLTIIDLPERDLLVFIVF